MCSGFPIEGCGRADRAAQLDVVLAPDQEQLRPVTVDQAIKAKSMFHSMSLCTLLAHSHPCQTCGTAAAAAAAAITTHDCSVNFPKLLVSMAMSQSFPGL